YPGPLYAVAAEQLVAKYPKLRDGSSLKYEVWRAHLRVKAKNRRRAKESTVPGVGAARAKHQKASEARQQSADARPAVAVQHIARRLSGVTYWGVAEDQDSVAGHLAFMAKEVRKGNPDWQKIVLSMERTFDERRHWMLSAQPLLADILARYPALGYPQAISFYYHFSFLRSLCLASHAELEAAIQKCGTRVVTLAERKWRLKATVDQLHKRLDLLPEGEKDGCFATGVLLLLPRLLKEDAGSYLQKLDPSKVHMHPTVLFSGDSAFSADSFLVPVEDLTLDGLDVLGSVSLTISLYWAFNIKYAPGTQKTFAVIERLVGLAFTQLTVLGDTVVVQVMPKERT
ncbi:unnamed protein product, partial [Ixodes persulcatus]